MVIFTATLSIDNSNINFNNTAKRRENIKILLLIWFEVYNLKNYTS